MKKRTVLISEELYKRVETKSVQNRFQSVDQYIEHLLNQMFHVEEEELEAEEEEQIKERLRKLGYI